MPIFTPEDILEMGNRPYNPPEGYTLYRVFGVQAYEFGSSDVVAYSPVHKAVSPKTGEEDDCRWHLRASWPDLLRMTQKMRTYWKQEYGKRLSTYATLNKMAELHPQLGYGIESLVLHEDKHNEVRIRYINMGDTYANTLIAYPNKITWGSWGALAERDL